MICVLIDPRSFGAAPVHATPLRQMVESAGALVYMIRQDDDLTAALSYRAGLKARTF